MRDCDDQEFGVYTEQYGKDQYQLGDLYLPKNTDSGTVCLFHGGFWKMPYDRFQLSELAGAIARKGFVVWNIEYRRTGWNGGGYPGTFDDAVEAVNYLITLKRKFRRINLELLYIAGHSAGGHLALWLGKKGSGVAKDTLKLSPSVLIGLAPVTDLLKCYEDKDRSAFVVSLMNSSPPSVKMEEYLRASPIAMLPLSIEQLVIHGDNDDALPVEESEIYAAASMRAGDRVELIKIDGGSHMDFINPESAASTCFIEWIIEKSKSLKPNNVCATPNPAIMDGHR